MPKKIDWSYHRPNCATCKKTEAWLEQHAVVVATQVNCKKEPLDAEAAIALARAAGQLYATKGQKVVHVDLKKDRPTDDELRALVVGPSGNLRAPTLKAGKTLIVGFQAELYADQLS